MPEMIDDGLISYLLHPWAVYSYILLAVLLLLWLLVSRARGSKPERKEPVLLDYEHEVHKPTAAVLDSALPPALRTLIFDDIPDEHPEDPEALIVAKTISQRLGRALSTNFEHSEFQLPTLPDTALRIKELADSADAATDELVAALSTDPAITARVMRAVNSAAFSSGGIHDLHQAVVRLGKQAISNLVTSVLVRDLMEVKDARIVRPYLDRLWQHSVKVAATSQAIARRLPHVDQHAAMLCGLIHDIGSLIVLTAVHQQNPDLLRRRTAVSMLILERGADAGDAALSVWGYPNELRAVGDYDHSGDRQAPDKKYANLVVLAKLLETQSFDADDGEQRLQHMLHELDVPLSAGAVLALDAERRAGFEQLSLALG